MRLRPLAPLLLAMLAAACAPTPRPVATVYHRSDADVSITRIAHGGVVVQMGETPLVVDPWLHGGLFTYQREPLGLRPATLPPAAAVLLTHEHGDHFDAEALAALARSVPRAVCPPPLARRVAALGFREVTALDWWEEAEVGGVHVTAVPARHAVRENGYVLATPRAVVYLAGDTRPHGALAAIAKRFGPIDVALLPIGGRRVFGMTAEMGPAEAAAAARTLGARRVVPIGYGRGGGFPVVTYARHPVERFREAARAAGLGPGQVVVLEPGESWHYTR